MDSKCSGTDTVSKKTGATEDNPQGYYKHTTDVKNWNLLVNIARDYRSCRTEAENALWQAVRAKKTGYKIRRQHVVNGYIADFINLEKQVIIEVDGGIHRSEEQVEKDNLRTAILNENGFHVIRYTNEEILTDSRAVAYKIKNYLDSVPSKRDDSENCEDISKNPCGDISESSPLPCGEGPGERFKSLTVFTTRPDTIFGVTFMVLAPESEYVAQTVTPEQRAEVEAYIESTKRRTERERIADRKVTGVFSGGYAINPFSGEEVPIWISDYVLAGYGTGAIMAVPAHDSRDYAFAKHFGLPVIPLIEGCDVSEESFDAKEGIMINSGFLNGLTVPEAIERAKEYVEDNGLGVIKVNYRLRDAIFSRQRYWGEPFPVYYKDGMPYNIPEEDLPLVLPEVDKFLPTETGEPPLGRAKNWTYNGYPLEFSTMPGFAGSSAYYLRYMDPHNTEALVSKEADEYWRNVDLYIGGTEHATGHLIYSRFWNKFLYDTGTVVEQEPFRKLVNQGMIQGCSNFVYRVKGTNTFISYGLKDTRDTSALHVDVNIVNNNILDIKRFKQWRPEYEMAEFILEDGEYRCGAAVEKMSKSLYNVVNPDDIVVTYGADTLRLYEMFLGPLEQSKPWDTKGIDGVHRFLRKFWRLFHHEGEFYVSGEAAVKDELKVLHRTIKKVQADIESFSFNTAVSAFMICVNELIDLKCNKKEILEPLTVILSPFAPHIAEELWHLLGNTTSVVKATFPEYDGSFLVENSFEYPISFNGKTRFKIELPLNADTGQIKELVLANAHTQKFLDGRQPKKIIVVSGKIVNIVI
jgi:leucyl-tRNA synthetase